MEIIGYINILKDTLEKKITILQALLEATMRQSEIVNAEEFQVDEFELCMDQKEALLEQLNELDEGFDGTYRQIQSSLKEQKDEYREELLSLQSIIRRCVDLGVELQTLEERNRSKLEIVFSRQQKELRQVKTNSKSVSNYYKTMNVAQGQSSYFMDQKK